MSTSRDYYSQMSVPEGRILGMDELDAAIELIASLATDRIGELDAAELVEFARKSEQAAHLIQALQVSVADQVRQRSDPS